MWISNEHYPWLSLTLTLLQPVLVVVCRAAPTWRLGNKAKGAKKDRLEYNTSQTRPLLQDSSSCHWASLKRGWEKMEEGCVGGGKLAAAPRADTLHMLNIVHLGAPAGTVCLHLGHNTGWWRCTFPLQLHSITDINAFIPGTVWDLMTLLQKILRD